MRRRRSASSRLFPSPTAGLSPTAGPLPRLRRVLLSVAAVLGLLVTVLVGMPGIARAAGSQPCDIYAAAGTPCVAAHSSTRALFSAYNGPLYQVTRVSDGATADIGLLTAGGYANAAQQDGFCANTTCSISKVYDQTSRHNDLFPGPAGTAGMGADRGADAGELSVTAGGHKVYGIWISPGVGYRSHGAASGTAVNGQAEGAYMVASGTHVGSACCFDYGNAEATPADTGNGHMDAVSIATTCYFAPCSGSGPWVEADLENGMFQGDNGSNTANKGNNSTYVTAVLKNNGQTTYALKGGNSQSGGLTTWWDGALPSRGGYRPMQQEGGIILGTGGDNSNWNMGTFFEGVMVSGYPTDAAENAVQANIVSVGYSGQTNVPNGPQGTVGGPGGQCVDVAADDTGVNGAAVQLWNCQSYAEDQFWTHNAGGSLGTIGRCLDIIGNGTANGTQVELWDCNGVGGQKWVQRADGSLFNPQSGRCLDSPNGATANGTRLRIWDCNGSAAQRFAVNAGAPVIGPAGTCADVAGDDNGSNATAVQLWSCQSYAVDQHWFHSSDGRLHTLGRCLDIIGNGTANGTQVELWDCNGAGGQVWQQQADGSLLNPQSGRCLDSPDGATANGTRLRIWDCNGSAAQKYALG
ncbi:arabinofuranosidase catalytic domain-containing protein [Streptomyces sp. NPDC001914]|uniref:arabinofuranosidase catalytic domain-containing protein n=1 Tax=Streptomyces sp. NPDC001914 TaxID=3364623 RepID=UPI00367DEA8D